MRRGLLKQVFIIAHQKDTHWKKAARIAYGLPELIAPSAARIHAEWRVELERRIDQIRKEKGLRAVW